MAFSNSSFPISPLVLDTFTASNATNLESHTTDSGHTWSKGTSGAMTGGSWQINNNQGSPTSGQNGGYFITSGSFSTDVSIQVDTAQTNSTNTHSGLAHSVTADFANASYIPVNFQGVWKIFKAVSGNFNTIGSTPTIGSEWLTTNTFADVNVIRWCRRTVSSNAVLSLYCNGNQVWTYTDNSGVLAATLPGVYNDNGSGGADVPFDNFKVFNASQEIGVLMIGDSISQGYITPSSSPVLTAPYPNIWLGNALSKGKKGLPVYVYNAAYTGTQSSDWVNTTNGANLATGISALSSQSIKVASIMLGVNDSKTSTRVSIATHASNIASIIATLKTNGFNAIFLHMPTYTQSGAFGAWDSSSELVYMPAYREAQIALVDNQTVFLGDTQGKDVLATNVSGDGIHPTATMSRILFQSHANSMLPVLNGLVRRSLISAF